MSSFHAQYESKKITPAELARQFKPGDYVNLSAWYGEPYGTIAAISEECRDIESLCVNISISTSEAKFMHTLPQIACVTGFFGPNERAAQAANDNIFYTPMQYTDGQRLVRMGAEADYFVHRVCPMDERGMFNFGMTSSWEYNAIRYVKEHRPNTKIVFEVNPRMRKVFGLDQFGDNELSIDYPDIIVEDDAALLDYPVPPPNDVETSIARNVASLIENKASVQLGFGTIPMAIGHLLCERRELGIHTEMLCEAHIDLIEAGAVTNAHKGLYEGISVATFALGTQRLHDWIAENPDVAMVPVEEINGIDRIARVNKLSSVNSVLTVDMTGQACAHCLGAKTYSGMGGAFEFACGSQLSPGGQSISCLPSTTELEDGTRISNIVPQFEQGARITIPEHTIDWVVTEFGAARLKCLPLEQRAQALIGIAHPDFREPLAKQMRDAGMRLDMADRLPAPPESLFRRR